MHTAVVLSTRTAVQGIVQTTCTAVRLYSAVRTAAPQQNDDSAEKSRSAVEKTFGWQGQTEVHILFIYLLASLDGGSHL